MSKHLTDVRAEVVKLATRGLRGTFIAPTSRELPTWGERYRPEPGDCIVYGSWDVVAPSGAVAFLVDDATGSDYVGSDYTVANLRWLRTNAEEFGFEVSGGHGTYGWALLLDLPDADPDWVGYLLEVLEGLIDYPIIDEQMCSEVEMEWEDEAWTSWAAADFERTLRKRFPGDAAAEAIDNLADAELRALFEQYREVSNTDWFPENSGSHIDIDRIVNAIPADAFPADA